MATLRNLVFFSIILTVLGCDRPDSTNHSFESNWDKINQRVWVGGDFWANRMADWEIIDGNLTCVTKNTYRPMRTVHWLTGRMKYPRGNLNMSVRTGYFTEPEGTSLSAATGFLLGARDKMSYKDAALIHGHPGPGGGVFLGFNRNNELFIKDFNTTDSIIFVREKVTDSLKRKFYLQVAIKPVNDHNVSLKLSVSNSLSDQPVKTITTLLDSNQLLGNIALVNHPGAKDEIPQLYNYSDLKISGDRIELHPDRKFGPVVSAQYALSDSNDRYELTAQLMPYGNKENTQVILQTRPGSKWETIGTSKIEFPGFVASFKDIPVYNTDTPYRIVYRSVEDNSPSYLAGILRSKIEWKKSQTYFGIISSPDFGELGYSVNDGTKTIKWNAQNSFQNANEKLKDIQTDYLFTSELFGYYNGSTAIEADNLYYNYLYRRYMWCWAFKDVVSRYPQLSVSKNEISIYKPYPLLNEIQLPEWYKETIRRVETMHLNRDAININLKERVLISEKDSSKIINLVQDTLLIGSQIIRFKSYKRG